MSNIKVNMIFGHREIYIEHIVQRIMLFSFEKYRQDCYSVYHSREMDCRFTNKYRFERIIVKTILNLSMLMKSVNAVIRNRHNNLRYNTYQ